MLVAHERGGFAGQLDIGLGGQPQRCGPLGDVRDAQLITDYIKEIVARIGDRFHNRLVGVLGDAAGVDPAAGLVHGVGLGKRPFVGNARFQRDGALCQRAQAGDQLIDGAGRVARADGAVEHGVAVVVDDLRPAAHIDGALEEGQVVIRIAGHGQDAAGIGIHAHDGAGLRQLDFDVVGDIAVERFAVGALPAGVGDDFQLLFVHGFDDALQIALGGLLQLGIDGKHDGVPVRGGGVGKLAHRLAARVDLHVLLPLPVFDVGRELILHGGFDARRAHDGVVGIALGLVFLQAFGIDLAGVAHHVRGQRFLRIHARGAFQDGEADQLVRAGLDFRNRLEIHVISDGHGAGGEVRHARGLPDGQHLELHLFVQIVRNGVIFAQRVEQFLHRLGVEHEIAAPLADARFLHGGIGRAGIELPVSFFVPREPEFGDGGLSVGLDQFDGRDDGLRVRRAVRR